MHERRRRRVSNLHKVVLRGEVAIGGLEELDRRQPLAEYIHRLVKRRTLRLQGDDRLQDIRDRISGRLELRSLLSLLLCSAFSLFILAQIRVDRLD